VRRLLLDTHAFLWWLTDDPALGAGAKEAIADPGSAVYVSAATVWEIAIKEQIGRLEVLDADIVAEISANEFAELPVAARHAYRAGGLPQHHADPFDRMLIAQAQLEGLICVTCDPSFEAYGVPVLW
jgi:PIN domain nuclease of toxin-antitoxin system